MATAALKRTLWHTNGTLNGSIFDDVLALRFSHGTINAGAGDDALLLTYGGGRLFGGSGNDRITVYQSRATVDAGSGNDTMFLKQGEGVFKAGTGNDYLSFYDSKGDMYGGAGNDRLLARQSDADLFGGAGDDILRFDDGMGKISGGAGADLVIMGHGSQGVVFGSPAEGGDRVVGFNPDWDWIELGATGFVGLPTGRLTDTNFTLNGADSTAPQMIYETWSGRVLYDADGTDGGAAVLIATFSDLPVLTASAFLIA